MAKDLPVGRIGYVFNGGGAGAGKWSGHGVLRRCQGCGEMYPKSMGDCPECETPPHPFNKWLRTAQLNSQLYESAGLRKP